MKFHVTDPVTLRIEDVAYPDDKHLEAALQFHDKRVDYELNKFKHNRWYAEKHGIEAYNEKLQALKQERFKTLLYRDEKGMWTYSGLANSLCSQLQVKNVTSDVKYPQGESLPWNQKPLIPYPFQNDIIELMLKNKHCGVEAATGLGKSNCIAHIVRRLGLKTVIMAPSKSIAGQLHARLVHDLGKRMVGFYGDSKHVSDKLITVGIAASLTRITPNSKAWEDLSKADVFLADESHLVPSVTLSKICFGLMAKAPYRFFFSGTQMRNDGLDLMLDGITGPIVYRKTVKQGIEEGYLAKLDFTMFNLNSDSRFDSYDANEMTRRHLYYNEKVNRTAAELANKFVSKLNSQVLILVEEIEQYAKLLPFFSQESAFAHAGGPEAARVLPLCAQKSNPDALVQKFNDGKLPILVGTSCIATGTDLRANKATIYLRGGRSQIEVMQGAIGRSTRNCELVGKTNCQVIDFKIQNTKVLKGHAEVRKSIYEQIAPVRELIQE